MPEKYVKNQEISILLVSRQPGKLFERLKEQGYHVLNISSGSDGFSKLLNDSFDLVYLAYSEVKKEMIALIEKLANFYGIMVVAV